MTPTPTLTPRVRAIVVATQLRPDSQNVHDHSISQTTRQNAAQIVEEGADYDSIELVDCIMDRLRESKLSDKEIADAFRVLVSLVTDKIESIGCSQLDVLNAVMNKIDGVKDGVVKKNLFETLGKNLASGVEREHVVCSTGKIARIVSTLEGTGLVKNKAVPIEVVRREIGQLASKVRDDVLQEASAEDVDVYNTGGPSNLSVKMKKGFRDEIESVYVEGIGLSPKVLEPMVAIYAKEF